MTKHISYCVGPIGNCHDEKCRDRFVAGKRATIGRFGAAGTSTIPMIHDCQVSGSSTVQQSSSIGAVGREVLGPRSWSITQCGIKLPMENCWRGELTWTRLYKTCSRFRLRLNHSIQEPSAETGPTSRTSAAMN